MKRIKLTQGKYALVDDEDYEWLNQWKWCVKLFKNISYAARTEQAKSIYMHRRILKLMDGKIHIDHRDHNGLNNQRDNLRLCTPSQNSQNSRPYGKSKYLGVTSRLPKAKKHKRFKNGKPYKNNCWVAYIHIGGNRRYLGLYATELEAAIIYNIAARKYHGEFANPNIFY